ncbi:hypothetical protein NA57DRAFT_74095 [Rhizodiscina lignyota]|uniref:DUF7702 domain-containing protein n=1 Tax=Rhizodiscina lignyota TaxID=1504668 RepID=A0A9P4IIA2_9PEZI|nr:hypothetical protein NA57DRAFT_74095 [Rhizodiscina lignyota]
MTLNVHSDVGIAQIAFYIPALFATCFLIFHKHGRPRMAWTSLVLFSSVRIAEGAILVVFENHPQSVGYIIAGLVFQGTGVIPLILSTIGLLRIIKFIDFPEHKRIEIQIIALRVILLVGVTLVIAGSCLQGNYNNASDVSTGTKLSKAGYILFAAIVGAIIAFDLLFWTKREGLAHNSSLRILYAISASVPFLTVRIIYSCLSVFSGNLEDPTWSPLFGSIAALIVMHSLMEYIVVVMYLATGFAIPLVEKNKSGPGSYAAHGRDDEEAARRATPKVVPWV